jgi:ABC-type xylose transport system substrate-binding protein
VPDRFETEDLMQMLRGEFHHHMEPVMTALQDLQAAVTAQTSEITAVVAAFQSTTAALTAALANNDDAGVEAAVATLNSNTAALAALLPTTPTPVAPTGTVTSAGTIAAS